MKRLTLRVGLYLVAGGILAGCGTMRSYDSELGDSTSKLAAGQVDLALQAHEQKNSSADKDLLYYFEKGEMLRLKKSFVDSRDAWLKADEQIRIWEEDARTDPEKYLKSVGSVLVNDNTRRYDGYDYEKVLLSSFLALDHVSGGDWNAARTEVKKSHEREALILELNAKKYAKVEEEAGKNRKVKTSFSTLKGYPVETLDDPEVVALRNGYQSAFSHYLAGFVYEALGESSLAAAGYRQAIELKPETGILKEGLGGLDTRVSAARRATDTDVLFIVESGLVPARQSMEVSIPIPTSSGPIINRISFPVLRPDRSAYIPPEIVIDSRASVPITPVTSIDAMSRRVLRDDMPGIILRTTVRATTRGVAQAAIGREVGRQFGALGGLLANAASSAANVVVERADERSWRTLPAHLSIGRTRLPAGTHNLSIPTAAGWRSITVTVSGKHAVVPLRMIGNHLYVLHESGAANVQVAAPGAEAKPVPVSAKMTVTAVAARVPASTVTTSTIVSTSTSAVSAPVSVATPPPVPGKPRPETAASEAPAIPGDSSCSGGRLADRFRCANQTSAVSAPTDQATSPPDSESPSCTGGLAERFRCTKQSGGTI